MKHLLNLLFLTLLISCTSNTIYEKPENLISKDSMVIILEDLYIANAAKNIETKFKTKSRTYLPLVYEKYKIDSTRFFESNNYYISKIDVYEEILNEVKAKIAKQSDSIKAIVSYKDSIKNTTRKARKKLRKKKDSIQKLVKKTKNSRDSIKRIQVKDSLDENYKKQQKLLDSIAKTVTENTKLVDNLKKNIRIKDSILKVLNKR